MPECPPHLVGRDVGGRPGGWGLPAIHVLVSIEHLLPQLLGLDPAGELEVGEFLPQQLRPQECLWDEATAQMQCQKSRITMAVPAWLTLAPRHWSHQFEGTSVVAFHPGVTSAALLQLQLRVVKHSAVLCPEQTQAGHSHVSTQQALAWRGLANEDLQKGWKLSKPQEKL